MDSSAFPKRSRVYEGNVNESATFAEMISDLHQNTISDRQATVVMDAGIAIEDNIDYLKEHSLPYLVVSRKAHREFDETGAVVVKDDTDCRVTVQKVHDPDTSETLLYCHSSQREKKEAAINQLFSTCFEEALEYLKQGLGMKRRLKKIR